MTSQIVTRNIVWTGGLLLSLVLAHPVAAQSLGCDPRVGVCQEWIPVAVVQTLVKGEQHDRRFQLAEAALIATNMMDLAVTEHAFGRQRGTEVWLLRGLEDRPVAFGLLSGGILAARVWCLRDLHRAHPRAAFWTSVAISAVQVAVVAHNVREAGR